MNINKLAFIIAVFSFWRAVPLLPPISLPVYYGIFGITAMLLVFQSYSRNNSSLMLFLLASCSISILFNEVPAYFQPWQRLISFGIMLATIGSLFESEIHHHFRFKTFEMINWGIITITILSSISYGLRLPFAFGPAGFQGFTNQSMMLSPIAACSAIISLHLLYTKGLNQQGNKKIIYIILLVTSALTALAAGSRGALGAMIIGMIYYLYKTNQNNIVRFVQISTSIIIISVISFPLWMPYTEAVRKKQDNAEKQGKIYASREDVWEDRINEFKSSPYIGVGFSSMDPNISRSHFDKKTGNIEPGSGWLFLLSSIGIFGTIIFSILVLKPLIAITKTSQISPNAILIGSLLSFFIIHLFVEGYVMASGSFLFIYLWLVISLSQDKNLLFKFG